MAASHSGPPLTAVALYIQDHLDEPLDLATLAQHSGRSAFQLHRAFTAVMGETPRQHIERLRLELAYRRLALSDDTIRDVCRAVGFRRHETFARSFRRRFRVTPGEVRRRSQDKRTAFLTNDLPPADDDCELSDVRFVSLRASFMLARRRVGDYAAFNYAPFTTGDPLWSPLARLAARRRVRRVATGWGFLHDIPGLTPSAAQRFDACLCIEHAVPGTRDIRCLRFDGGPYAVIDHIGPQSTLMTAYTRIVHHLGRVANRFIHREGPSLVMYRAVHVDRHRRVNHTTVCMPVASLLHG
jgi:AraC family transcriptional regulator